MYVPIERLLLKIADCVLKAYFSVFGQTECYSEVPPPVMQKRQLDNPEAKPEITLFNLSQETPWDVEF